MAALGAIENWSTTRNSPGRKIFLEGADGADGNDALHTKQFHSVNIGAEIQFAGHEAVATAMARKEGHTLAFECANDNGVRGLAERGFHANFASAGQAAHGIEAAAADHADFGDGGFRPRTLPFADFFAFAIRISPGSYRFRSTGSISIFPSRSWSLAAATSESCAKTTIHPSFTNRGSHLRLVSSVCMGYKS